MKNLFLSLAFMLVGTFAFANISEISIDLNKIESLINVSNLEDVLEEAASDCGFPVFYNDGSDGSGPWGGSGVDYYSFSCRQSPGAFGPLFEGWLGANFPGFQSVIIRWR